MPPTGLHRRTFLKLGGASALGAWIARFPRRTQEPQDPLVPADKRLAPEWLRSLTERGAPTTYVGEDLRRIGMPVGGICCGQLYLGGDGRLWFWDIFNQPAPPDSANCAGPHYAHPMLEDSALEQGFGLRLGGTLHKLHEFPDIAFQGQYPLGLVEYRDPALPVAVSLCAYSPFIPLNAADSGLPATIFELTLRNISAARVELELVGWLESAVCLASGRDGGLLRRNRLVRAEGLSVMLGTAEELPSPEHAPRPLILLDDFEHADYAGWTATGTAFGDGPVEKARMPQYQGDVNAQGERLVNSHNARQGEDVAAADAHTGTLTSRAFVLERDWLSFRIGGGAHAGRTCLNLLVDGAVAASATGRNDNRMALRDLDVRAWAGRSAQIQIVDAESGGWGNIGVDDIVLTDAPRAPQTPLAQRPDYGSMGLALLGADEGVHGEEGARPSNERLTGSLSVPLTLAPGEARTCRFAVVWHFPNPWRESLDYLEGAAGLQRHYAARFADALEVARHLAQHQERLAAHTRLWHAAWYPDSTLPWWFLERTLANASTLATSTCYRFADGRFYGWEGVYSCAGTCTHVWQYAQAVARLFPELERDLRERVDYGLAFHEDTGAIDYRGEAARSVAHDGQAGVILRAFREHAVSADNAFLARLWPRVRKSLELLIAADGDNDGLLEGPQYNTLDAAWYGKIPWISSLYLAALRAGEAMALEMVDDAFAERCRAIAERGSRALDAQLFDGEYYVQLTDPKHPEANSTNRGCHIDQVFGQSWAHQAGLPRVLPPEHTASALRALWKYNYTPDVGPYRAGMHAIQGGRWYAMPGEGGMLMCTFPKGGAEQATGKGGDAWAAGYFNECMSGFEHQVAGHMLWEGLTTEGLAVIRTIHDRYRAERRNPWNEIECGDHYARAMASYGVYLAACGYEHHGPHGHLGFAPRLTPEDFRCAFTAAEGWGSYRQRIAGRSLRAAVQLAWGRLRLSTLALELPEGLQARTARASVGAGVGAAAGAELPCSFQQRGRRLLLALREPLVLDAGQELVVEVA